MAAKGKAKGKPTKAPKQHAKTKVKKAKSPTTGMTAQQIKKFTKAAKKVQARQRIAKNANKYRKRRLATAKRVSATARRTYRQAGAARAVQYAIQQTSRQANAQHLSSATRRAAAARVFNATRIASSLKFQALGEQTHARTSILQTVTSSQAVRIEEKLAAKAARSARATARRKAQAFKRLKAQGKIPKKAKTMPKGYGINAKGQMYKINKGKKGRPKGTTKKKGYGGTGYSKQAVTAGIAAAGPIQSAQQKKVARARKKLAMKKAAKTAAIKAAASKKKAPLPKAKPKAAVVTPKVNFSEWITAGNDQGIENCLEVAIANHLYAWTGYKMDDDQVNSIKGATVYDALHYLKTASPFVNIRVAECAQLTRTHRDIPGSLVVFGTPKGCHAGVLLPGNKVVSWGEVTELESEVQEAYYVRWEVAEV